MLPREWPPIVGRFPRQKIDRALPLGTEYHSPLSSREDETGFTEVVTYRGNLQTSAKENGSRFHETRSLYHVGNSAGMPIPRISSSLATTLPLPCERGA